MTEHHDTVVDETSQAGQTEVAASTDATPAGDATDAHAAETDTVSAHSEASEADTDSDSDDATDATGAHDAGASGSTSRRRPAKTADLEREGEVAADFLETLLDIADLDGDIDVDVDGDRAAVSIVDSDEGRVPRRLVGPDGKVLDALQELTRLAVQSATGERSRLMLDVAGHRAERRAALVTIAQKAIADVKATGQQASLEPMTAFERKVVHDEVLAAGLVSESDGVEPRRFVVVLPG
ncbi:RNA-binding protein [Phycicoccus sp. Root563]|uniref:Jag family protein n=1 Tax=Phycicoccus sp. Root563 TaxID=1736562 RepID=UPI0007030B78|nr:R3H domain-containing nucleic acid-binding protein [Phycicoccus sp. Root563]KQZ91094.1 RNA-binding protein [Phycicoccus sp. Root563]